jgi:glycosyltransferase involved in cell wall biosynthesis
LKIFLLVSSFPDNHNRSRGIFNYRFVKQLVELKEDVFVVFFRTWIPGRNLISSYLYDGITVTQVCLPLVPFNSYYFIKFNIFICRTLGWVLLKNQLKVSSIIHSVYLTNNGITAGFWARKLKIPHVSQAIGSDVNSDLAIFIKKKYINTWIKNIDGIIANSKDLERCLNEFIDDCPIIETIYRGIVPNDSAKMSFSAEAGTIFLYLGGLELNKRLKFGINTKGGITLMESWKKLEKQMSLMNAKLFFGGPNSNNMLFKNWRNSLVFPERVQLLGKIDPREVKLYLDKCDIVIIPSMEEGLPNFLMESAANKRAAIGSTAGGIPEVIVPGVTGYLFEKGNAEQLGDLLLQTAGNNEVHIKMGEAAYEHVKTHFNANNYSNNIIAFYKKILKNVWNSRDC